MDFSYSDAIRKIVHVCADEMFPMLKGILIPQYTMALRFGDGRLTRKHIKHIVEQRTTEHKSLNEIKQLLDLVPETIMHHRLEIVNRNKKYPGSIIRACPFKDSGDWILVVMDAEVRKTRDVITVFISGPKYVHALQNKNSI